MYFFRLIKFRAYSTLFCGIVKKNLFLQLNTLVKFLDQILHSNANIINCIVVNSLFIFSSLICFL